MSPWDPLFIKCIFDCWICRFYIIRGIQRWLLGFRGWSRQCWEAISKHGTFRWIIKNHFGKVVHFKMLNNSCFFISSIAFTMKMMHWLWKHLSIQKTLFAWLHCNQLCPPTSIVSQQRLWKVIQVERGGLYPPPHTLYGLQWTPVDSSAHFARPNWLVQCPVHWSPVQSSPVH